MWFQIEITKDLTGIDSPILIIAGEENKHETEGAVSYRSMQDNVHVSIIPFASHLVHYEQPELYSQILNKFLENIEQSSR